MAEVFIGSLNKDDAIMIKEYSRCAKVLEFGCGGSTQLFSQNATHTVSVDTEIKWCEATKEVLKELGTQDKVDFELLSDFKYEGKFDLIYVDGKQPLRKAFARQSWRCLDAGGIMLIHDTRRAIDQQWIGNFITEKYETINKIEMNLGESNMTLIKKSMPKTYVNWLSKEGKVAWMYNATLPRPDNWIEILQNK